MVILSLSDAENSNRRFCCEERAPEWNRNHDSRCNRVEWKREGRSDLLPVLNILHGAADGGLQGWTCTEKLNWNFWSNK